MLQIITSTACPNDTYFRVGDVEPELNGSTLTIYDGTGARRSWGAPGITSTIVLQSEDLTAIHVGFYHKHGGGQFWRYYRHEQQVTWAQLSDEERTRVLDAYENKCAPSWAKSPGKLRTSYMKPTIQTRTSYKLVRIVDNRYYSIFDGETEYVLGKRLAEKAIEEHGGGYYSYPTVQGVINRFHAGTLFPERCYQQAMTLALLECEISGSMVEYPSEKIASTYLRPIGEIQRFEYTPAGIKEAC